jgi:wobble nucleotide-excising tRNase
MGNKLTSAIKRITLNATTINGEEYAATFHGAEMEPTFVNFGFGNNGTGKSSVAKAIRDNVGIEWTAGKSPSDFNVLVYDRQFIDEHFANYGYLPGIYTMGDTNVEIQKQIDANTAASKKLHEKLTATTHTKTVRENAKNYLLPSFYDSFWQVGADIRVDFKKYFTGKLQKASFATALLQNQATPIQHDVSALKQLYDVAFGGTPETPDAFDGLNFSQLKRLSDHPLLEQSIVGSADSVFGRFVKAINATGWIKRGLDDYVPIARGKCPFCQQDLPPDFAEQVAACFDQQYQEDINALRQHRNDYERYTTGLIAVLSGNQRKNIYSKFSAEMMDAYDSKITALEKTFGSNLHLLDTKLSDPSIPVSLELVEAESICNGLNEIIAEYNRQVKATKDILANLRNKTRECERQVWESLAYEAQALVAKYKADLKKLNDDITALSAQIAADTKTANDLDAENGNLEKQIVSIKTAVDGINRSLKDSGFQGFELRVFEGSGQSAYRVIRPHTGKVAKDLSEGERNFIGFLYFYHLVKGSLNDNDLGKDKVVVIDDPVSSMDSTVLHIVGMLVREITDSCLFGKPTRGIQQVFVLTHNVHFHTKVANDFVSRYDVASYYLLSKPSNNISKIKHCVQGNPNIVGEKQNYNPVPSEYAHLWKDYKSENNPMALRSLIWQILDYYFIKLSSGSGDDLRNRVLIERRDSFVEQLPNGTEDNSKLIMATKLLSCMGATANGSDEEFYTDNDFDASSYRATFEMVFTAMEQDQHYRMMMTETEL